MYYQRPTRGAGLAQLLGGVLTGLAERHQNRLQERKREKAEQDEKTAAEQDEKTARQQDELREPITPEQFTDQLPQVEPRWKPRQQDSGLPPLFGNPGLAEQGGGQLRLARLLAVNPGEGGGAVPNLAGRRPGGAPGFGPSPRVPVAGSPGMRIRPRAGNGSPASPERVQKLVATWEDLHGQAATDAIRSQIADYVRTA